jgi:hypothetical protein
MLLSYIKHWTFSGYTDPIRHKFSIAHTTTDHVITVKNHQTQSQTGDKKKKLKQFWIIFFEKSQPSPFPVKWSVPNKSVTTTKQDISHTTLETQNQQVYPQNKEIYCNKYFDPIVACKI